MNGGSSMFRESRLRWVLGLSVLLALAVSFHLPYLNGPWYWDWPWRRLEPGRIFPWMAVAAIPFALAQWGFETGRLRIRGCLVLVALSTFLLELVAIGIQGPGFDLRRIVVAVQSPVITSYFTDAMQFGPLAQGLAQYPDRMADFHLHSINKPPGPILYYLLWIRGIGPALGAMLGGIGIGVLAALGVLAAYKLARYFGAGCRAAFAGASYFALCPGLVLFFPEFDQAYPLLACGLIGSWLVAVERGSASAALLFGGLLFVLTFMSFGLLVLGFLCVGIAWVEYREGATDALSRITRATVIGLGVVGVVYGLLWLGTGYNPVATFESAMANQAVKASELGRPWPITIPFDLLDFALGTGWLAYVLVGFWVADRWVSDESANKLERRVWVGLAQILVVAFLGLIPVETARVWLFMVPLLVIPVGIELARWTPTARGWVYGSLWLLMVLVGQNMVFLGA